MFNTARRGVITHVREKIWKSPMELELIWQRDGKEIFITCPGCTAINNITDFQDGIREGGKVSECVTCRKCFTHFWPKLEGWDGEVIYYCNSCSRRERARRLPKGWGRIKASCSCCKDRPRCPQCLEKYGTRRQEQ